MEHFRLIFGVSQWLTLFRAQVAQAASNSGEITQQGILVAVTVIVGTLLGGGGLIVTWVNHRFTARDAANAKKALEEQSKREDASMDAKNMARLIEGVLLLGQAVRDANIAQVTRDSAQADERKELREMLETKKQAEEGRDSVIGKINTHLDDSQTSMKQHMDDRSKSTDAGVQRLETKVDDLKREIDQLATKDDLKDQMRPFQKQIDEFAQLLLIIKKQTTRNLDPAVAIAAEAAYEERQQRAQANGNEPPAKG